MKWNNLSLTLKVRLISNFFQEIITTAFLPFMALYLSDMTSTKFAGIFLTLLVLLNFPISFFAGYLIEFFPKKKSVLLYQFLMSMMLLGMTFSITSSNLIIIFCVFYVIFNIVWGLQYPAMDTIIMDAITPDIESYIYKIDYWLTNVAVALGALLGGILYSNNQTFLFIVAFLVYLIIFFVLLKWLPKETNNTISKNKFNIKDIFMSYKTVSKDTRYVFLTIGFSIIMMGELSSSSYVAVRLKETFNDVYLYSIHIDGVKMYSFLIMINTIVVVTLTYHISKLVLNIKPKIILIFGLLMYIIGYSGITYLNQFYLLILFMMLATIGEIIYAPIFDEQKFKMIPEDKRGTYSAVNTIGFNFSELLARLGIVLGTIFSSFQMSIFMLTILSLGGFLMYISIFELQDKK
ncbi:MFS transporter [Staphylococcus aureus]|uniref:MDR family MFS transporter n=4 Tax=Staphylococcus aureus TaxID=1280 RepID=UPI0022EBEB4E|nr:MFS transporter [Staphylococcus aureus]MDA3752936.1 MFS transporter [Staphylococcus aureus]MDA4838753.1 MFS transporter [Staphylococcus aureus]MDA5404053.1 MFS transporter [Staphylococcus aureus]MDA5408327.1 MFS transporter [Staphylococcus aureus]MDA5430570.1 MFS transporter [Staphylococcus aureus]